MAGFDTVLNGIVVVQKVAIPFVITTATMLFLWGLLRYAFSSQHEGEQENGKKLMLYGVVTIFIASLVWGILTWLEGLAGVDVSDNTVMLTSDTVPDPLEDPPATTEKN